MSKNIAILGSSGGNLFNLGGKDPDNLLGEIVQQCDTAGIGIKRIQFIAASTSMDNVTKKTNASLFEWDEHLNNPSPTKEGTLEEINQYAQEVDQNVAKAFKRIQFRGIMMSSMPAFIALAITIAISKIPGMEAMEDVFDILITALPVVLAAIAAKQISGLDEVGIVAGVVAGTLSTEGGIIGGLVAGIIAGILAYYIFQKTVHWNFPMTTVNIVTGGLAGLASGLFVYSLIAPLALRAGEGIRVLIDGAIDISPILAGVVSGVLIWPAIMGGVYHAAILPIILLEMETTGNSFLGAVDMVGLTMVAAGINLANIVYPKKKGESTIALPGFLVNMGFGTYVESAYPFMFSNKVVFGGALFSAGLGGLFIGLFNARGTAYVPSLAGPFLSNNLVGFTISMLISLAAAFIITVIANRLSKSNNNAKQE